MRPGSGVWLRLKVTPNWPMGTALGMRSVRVPEAGSAAKRPHVTTTAWSRSCPAAPPSAARAIRFRAGRSRRPRCAVRSEPGPPALARARCAERSDGLDGAQARLLDIVDEYLREDRPR